MVFCVHHKPWLMMSTLITALAQDYQDVDIYLVYNVGSGNSRYSDAIAINPQLSPWDERVREVCRLKRSRVFELEYENDETLDSGAWYKFIRDGRWKQYDWVLFGGEGTLFARQDVVSAMLAFALSEPNVHIIASGHEKRRLPRHRFIEHDSRGTRPADQDRLHSQMIQEVFAIFSRDLEFARLFDEWGKSDFPVETQDHVPPVGPPSPWLRRVRSAWARRFGPPSDGGWLRQLPWSLECLFARACMSLPSVASAPDSRQVYVNGVLRPVDTVADVKRIGDVGFHRVDGPEWFACTGPHLMSRHYLERLSSKLDEFRIWDVLALRFAGTPLEVTWGFVPAWLGFEKWFTDGFHRVRKEFVTYRREDYPVEMATYINRYYRGVLAVTWRGDYIKVRAYRKDLERLRDQLPPVYFSRP